ncbi:hypothetical protein [Actinopolymorpha rutila]|uniref:Transcriptional regulator with XRE-family HTH domain n=1 Tax=Actinopolymorpha rutila TaxID=446787 RepID=A0A852ZGC9_9ACTN|nr:hypothetical protein [Actinopolymorpha rutila]NYH90938.1 transcriptional regulator with XRE-family HTH domain [Actinopolymorpha rutila]
MVMNSADVGARRRLIVMQRLRERRRRLGLTQKQVVSRLGRLGVLTTNKALSSLEHGAGLDVAKLPELAHALECTVTYLLGMTSDPRSWAPDTTPASQQQGPRDQAAAAANRPRVPGAVPAGARPDWARRPDLARRPAAAPGLVNAHPPARNPPPSA